MELECNLIHWQSNTSLIRQIKNNRILEKDRIFFQAALQQHINGSNWTYYASDVNLMNGRDIIWIKTINSIYKCFRL